MKLVDNAKSCWKWISMWCMTIAGAVQGAWVFVPDDMRTSLPPYIVQVATIVLLVLGVAGRLVDQKPKDAP